MASSVVTDTDITLNDASLSADEYAILMSLGRAKNFKAQQMGARRDELDRQTYRDNLDSGIQREYGRYETSEKHERRAAQDEARSRRVNPMGYGVTPAGRGEYSAGFAAAAVIPFIPLIGTAITGVVDVIKSFLTKRKGQGIIPANYSLHRGFGLALGRELKTRRGRHEDIDKALSQMRGPGFWHSLTKELKSEVEDILPKIADISPSMAQRLSTLAVNKALPPAFQERIARQVETQTQTGGGPQTQMASVVKPLVQYMLSEIVEDVDSVPEVGEMLDSEIANLDNDLQAKGYASSSMGPIGSGPKWDRFKTGAKSFFGSVMKHGKRILHKMTPRIVEVAKEEIPEILNFAARKIRLPGDMSDKLATMAKAQIPGLVDKIGDRLKSATAETAIEGPNASTTGSGFRRPQGMSVAKFNKLRREASYMADKFGPNAVKKHGKKLMSQGPEAMMSLGRYMNKKEPGYSNSDFHITNRLFAENIKNRYASGGASSSHPYEKNLTIGTKKKAFQVKIL